MSELQHGNLLRLLRPTCWPLVRPIAAVSLLIAYVNNIGLDASVSYEEGAYIHQSRMLEEILCSLMAAGAAVSGEGIFPPIPALCFPQILFSYAKNAVLLSTKALMPDLLFRNEKVASSFLVLPTSPLTLLPGPPAAICRALQCILHLPPAPPPLYRHLCSSPCCCCCCLQMRLWVPRCCLTPGPGGMVPWGAPAGHMSTPPPSPLPQTYSQLQML